MAAQGTDKIYATRSGVSVPQGQIANFLTVTDILDYLFTTQDFQDALNNVSSEGKPMVLVGSGQSNMASSNTNAVGGDISVDPDVFLWQGGNGWIVWDIVAGWNAVGGSANGNTRNNVLFQAAKELRRQTGRPQYCIINAHGGQSIDRWTDDLTDLYAELKDTVELALASTEMTSIGKTKIDNIFWFQGEADSANEFYKEDVDQLVSQLEDETWYPDGLTFIGTKLAEGFVQSTFWRQAANSTSYQIVGVETSDLSFPDNVHIAGTDMATLGYRYARAALGDYSVLARESDVIRPREGETGLVIRVGSQRQLKNVNDALIYLNKNHIDGDTEVTITLDDNEEYPPFDMNNLIKDVSIIIRSNSGAASSDPTALDLVGGETLARSFLSNVLPTRIVCQAGDTYGIITKGTNTTIRGLMIDANGQNINNGLEVVSGTTSLIDVAVMDFTRSQYYINYQGTLLSGTVTAYGGLNGIENFGTSISINNTANSFVCVAQTQSAIRGLGGSRFQSMQTIDIEEFSGDEAILLNTGSFGLFNDVISSDLPRLVRASTSSNIIFENMSVDNFTETGNVSAIRADESSTITFLSNININNITCRLANADKNSKIIFVDDLTVDTWNSSNEFLNITDHGTEFIVSGTLTLNNAPLGGSNDIRALLGGQIKTGGLTIPVSVGTLPATLNTFETTGANFNSIIIG